MCFWYYSRLKSRYQRLSIELDNIKSARSDPSPLSPDDDSTEKTLNASEAAYAIKLDKTASRRSSLISFSTQHSHPSRITDSSDVDNPFLDSVSQRGGAYTDSDGALTPRLDSLKRFSVAQSAVSGHSQQTGVSGLSTEHYHRAATRTVPIRGNNAEPSTQRLLTPHLTTQLQSSWADARHNSTERLRSPTEDSEDGTISFVSTQGTDVSDQTTSASSSSQRVAPSSATTPSGGSASPDVRQGHNWAEDTLKHW